MLIIDIQQSSEQSVSYKYLKIGIPMFRKLK